LEFSTRTRNQINKETNIYQGLGKNLFIPYEKLSKKILYLKNSGIYFGGLVNNIPEGYGLFWYNSGSLYCGFWEKGMPHRWGYFYNPS
jgi:hypothetical protein